MSHPGSEEVRERAWGYSCAVAWMTVKVMVKVMVKVTVKVWVKGFGLPHKM